MDSLAEPSGQIVEFAMKNFFRYGYSSVTVDEIVAELRMSKATFYRFFKSKEDLLGRVIRSYSESIVNRFPIVKVHDPGTYIEQFRRLADFIAETLRQIDARARDDIRTSVPKLWESLQELQHRSITSILASFFRAGRECGLLRPEIDPDVSGELLAMTVEGLLAGETRKNPSLSRVKALQTLADIIMNGFLAVPRRALAQ